MPNDAKFGLVVGVGLVIAVAIVFFRKDHSSDAAPSALPATGESGETVLDSLHRAINEESSPPPRRGPANAQTATFSARPEHGTHAPGQLPPGRKAGPTEHIIEDGDTLFALSRRYYGDVDHFMDIYHANRDVIQSPDRLPVGAKIRIP